MKFGLLLVFAAGLLAACSAQPVSSPVPTQSPSLTSLPTATFTLEATASETAIPISSICSPLAGHSFQALKGYIAQGFTPPPSASDWDGGHHGLDFAYYQRSDEGGVGGHINGTPIQSVLDGVVAGEGFANIYGNYLIIETPRAQLPPDMAVIYGIGGGESIYLLYAHMQEPAPFVLSEPIDCGQQVGKVGNSGNEYFIVEPHLHFEIRVGASANRLDALNYYDTRATEQEKIEYRRWRNSDEFQLFDPTLLIDYGIGQEDGND